MPDIKQMITNFKRIVSDLPETRQKLALIMAADAHALTADRIQNTGVNSRGEKMRLYSENPFNLGLLNPTDFNAPSKVEKFKKDASKGKNNGSYAALRRAYGLPTDKRTLTFDGDMFKSIEQVVTEHDNDKTIVSIKAKDRANQNKVNWNSGMVASNILSFGDDEKELIRELNKKRIKELLKNS